MLEFRNNSNELAAFVVSVFVLGVSRSPSSVSPLNQLTERIQLFVVGDRTAAPVTTVRDIRPPHYLPHFECRLRGI